MNRIYLDNAATSWPKPERVYAAVDRYLRHCGASAGRGAYREAVDVERAVLETRRRAASLLNVSDPSRIIFTSNGTDSLNLALHGLLRQGDHVITSVAEHNSVLRPLRLLERTLGVDVTRVQCDGQGIVDPADIRAAWRSNTRLVALIHASNVTGALQPVTDVGQVVRAAAGDALFLVDAAQSLGHVRIDASAIGADLIAAPGHKGLLGPLGTGVLYIADGVERQLQPVRQGGTGTQSERDEQPGSLPDRYESGNHNVPGIIGLGEGMAWLAEHGESTFHERSQTLTQRLLDGLTGVAGVTVYGPLQPDRRVGVVSITVDGYDPQEVASLLDSAWSIQVRAGLHCAPRMHASLGTAAAGGTVRFSPGPFTTESDIDQTVEAIGEITSA